MQTKQKIICIADSERQPQGLSKQPTAIIQKAWELFEFRDFILELIGISSAKTEKIPTRSLVRLPFVVYRKILMRVDVNGPKHKIIMLNLSMKIR